MRTYLIKTDIFHLDGSYMITFFFPVYKFVKSWSFFLMWWSSNPAYPTICRLFKIKTVHINGKQCVIVLRMCYPGLKVLIARVGETGLSWPRRGGGFVLLLISSENGAASFSQKAGTIHYTLHPLCLCVFNCARAQSCVIVYGYIFNLSLRICGLNRVGQYQNNNVFLLLLFFFSLLFLF